MKILDLSFPTMSGHSKWAKIHRQKAVTDAKKSATFSKIAKQIALAAKKDTNVDTNFTLRLAIDAARAVNMPKENIERAIAKASSKSEAIEEFLFEGYAPQGIALIVQITTDNKNRTVQEIKTIFNKNGGKIADLGSVSWMFEYKGAIILPEIKNQFSADDKKDEFIMNIIDAGALDVIEEEDNLIIYTKQTDLKKIKDKIEELGYKIENASLDYVAKDLIDPDEDKRNQVENFLSLLDENDDVSNIYTNLK